MGVVSQVLLLFDGAARLGAEGEERMVKLWLEDQGLSSQTLDAFTRQSYVSGNRGEPSV